VGKRLGLWKPEEEQLLRELWERRADGSEVIASFPGRTLNGIRYKAYSLKMLFKNMKTQAGKKVYVSILNARGRIENEEPMINDKPAMRKCLTCGFVFLSAGPQNRLCQIHRYGDGT